MVKGLYTAYTGLINEQNRMDVLTNNLANANTVGFKKEGSTSQAFDDVLAYKIKDTTDPLSARPLGGISLGVKIGETYTDFSQGSMRSTENTFDLAVSGTGFFAVEFTNKNGESSTKYTRDGSFILNKDGYLVTKDGDYVLGSNNNRIRLDPNQPAMVDQAGRIWQNDAVVATVGITDFEDYNYLEHYGENYYQPVEGATQKAGDYKIMSGYLEMANMSVVTEMVNMISVSRAYETNQKMVQTFDSTLEIASKQLGRVQ